MLTLFFKFVIGHALGDFVLQNEVMARAKSRHYVETVDRSPDFPRWYYWLSGHALIHGGIVLIVSGSALLGLIETCLHAGIDFAKCEHKISFHQDQALHMVCKLAYCFVLPLLG